MRLCLLPLLAPLLAASLAPAQTPTGNPGWVVRPEWVRTHEEFLASDVLAGRGSATRDEHLAATYVASEFIAYGLQPAPGSTGYLQTATVIAPELDGKATLALGSVVLHEGPDFHIVSSSGASVSGPLRRVPPEDLGAASPPPGSVLLLASALPLPRLFTAMRRVAAVAVLIPEDEATRTAVAAGRFRTRTRARLAPDPTDPEPADSARTVIALTPAAQGRLASAANGAPTRLTLTLAPGPATRETFNAIGFLPGTDPAAGNLLLSAHLDHLGIARPVDGDAIYNGANDDASGTTAVLELAHALAAGPRPTRGILFVCYGSEEIGELGSTYFGRHPPVPLTSLVANLEFEMIGNQDPKMPPGTLLLTGWDRSNLGPTLREHGAMLGPDPYPEQHFFERSDNYALALKGVVAHTAGGWGTPPTYHRPSDDLAHLDLPFMTRAIQSFIEPVRWLATHDFKPTWNPGQQPTP